MKLKKITEVLSEEELNLIHEKASLCANAMTVNNNLVELLYNKYFLQFIQESVRCKK